MIISRVKIALAIAGACMTFGAGAALPSRQPISNLPEQQYSPAGAVGDDGKASVIIILKDAPATKAYLSAFQKAGGGSMALNTAQSAAHSAVAALRSEQNALVSKMQTAKISFAEIYRVQRVLNAIAVRMRPQDMAAVRKLPEVERVQFLATYERPSNLASVPFIGAAQVWDGPASLGLPFGATGKNIRIGDIDTGLDYIHPDFGGSGTLAAYQDVDPTSVIGKNSHAVLFPTTKVVGGYDFAGDAYTARNLPQPDENPMDCGGHGTHTAGTIAGVGVNSDGSAYAGVYNTTAPYSANLLIGPGVAPDASLYALRVFGCGGSTNLVTPAIDWAVDPNNDDDFSDRLDVINMSLGSPFGVDSSDFDAEIEAVNNAAEVGMIVVSSAGNDGDSFFVSGSPGAAHSGLSVAASVDDGQIVTELHVNSPAVADFNARASGFTNPNGIAPPAPNGQAANIVRAIDAVGGASFGCGAAGSTGITPGAFSNAAALSNNLALIDRGSCSFYIKVLNAQAAGAKGVIIDDNTPEALIFMGNPGTTLPTPITVPSVFISQADGATIKTELASTVAASFNAVQQPQLADTLASFSSRGPVIDATGAVSLKPDLAAPGLNIPSAQTGITCSTAAQGCITPSNIGIIPGGQPLVLSGTSMAAPHVTGTVALLRQLNPSATVEQIKAMAINTASHDVTQGSAGTGNLFGASRVGAGRVDVADAATATVLAYNADDANAISVTFDVEPIGPNFTATHKVTLANHTAIPKSVTLSVQDVLIAPGVSFSVPSGAISIPAAGQASFNVTLNADTSAMTRYIDPSMSLTQNSVAFGNVPFERQYIAERSALILVNVGGSEVARLPVYAALRPHSDITATVDPASTSTTATLDLAGNDVCTGTVSPNGSGTSCNVDTSTGEESFVSAFELQLTGAQDDTLPGWANLQYVGVNSAPDSTSSDVFFGVSTFGRWGSQGKTSINVCIDTDNDGKFDTILFNTDMGTFDAQDTGVLTTASPQDTYSNFLYTNATLGLRYEGAINLFDPDVLDSGALSNNSMILSLFAGDLGLTGTKLHYGVAVCPGFNNLCGTADWTRHVAAGGTAHCGTDASAYQHFDGPFVYDLAAPGVDGTFSAMFQEDLNGNKVDVAYNAANLSANQSTGILLLHTHNTAATSAQVVIPDRIFANGFESN